MAGSSQGKQQIVRAARSIRQPEAFPADSAAAAEQLLAVHLGAFSSAQVLLSMHRGVNQARLPAYLATPASL